MRISIFGLGYVGAVTAACMSKEGNEIIGVDPDSHKRDLILAGKSPIVEEGLEELIRQGVESGRLTVTHDFIQAIENSDISLVCVGTPSLPNGGLKTEYVQKVSQEIGTAIKKKNSYHSVVIRSTVLPGTTENIVKPILESSTGGKAGESFGLSMNPEFLREGVSIKDYYAPPFTVIGTDSETEYEKLKHVYKGVGGDFIHCKISTAEAIKYGCNIFHALKITFANEMGMLCKQLGVDSQQVLEIICKDTKLNISSKYMKPGFAFGGSCLPKDLRAFTQSARENNISLPMFEAALSSNKIQIERVAERIMQMGSKKISFMGISFKEGTDDLRESPLVSLAEILIGRGCDLKIFDPNVHYASLYGSNKAFIDAELPHLKRILVDADSALDHGDIIVFAHDAHYYKEQIGKIKPHQKVFDLVRIANPSDFLGEYNGLYW